MKKVFKNLITAGLVTGLSISSSLMVFAAEWQNINEEWYYVGDDGTITTENDFYYNADGSLKNALDMEKFIGTFSTEQGLYWERGTAISIDKIEDGKAWGTYEYSYHTSGPNDVFAEAEFNGVEIKDGRIEIEYDYNYVHTIWGEIDGKMDVVDSDDGEGTGTLQLTFVDNDNGIFEYNTDLNRHCSIQVNILDGFNEIPNERVYPILEQ